MGIFGIEEANEADARLFTRLMKEECWKRSRTVPGRDPERWRLDAAGNIVAYRLRACDGCLCHEYDHITPFSKGGRTEVENCQILQSRANRYKGNEDNEPKKLVGYSCARVYSGGRLMATRTEAELDLIEVALYGNVKRQGLECRVFSVYELFQGFGAERKPPAKLKGLPNCPGGLEKPPSAT